MPEDISGNPLAMKVLGVDSSTDVYECHHQGAVDKVMDNGDGFTLETGMGVYF